MSTDDYDTYFPPPASGPRESLWQPSYIQLPSEMEIIIPGNRSIDLLPPHDGNLRPRTLTIDKYTIALQLCYAFKPYRALFQTKVPDVNPIDQHEKYAYFIVFQAIQRLFQRMQERDTAYSIERSKKMKIAKLPKLPSNFDSLVFNAVNEIRTLYFRSEKEKFRTMVPPPPPTVPEPTDDEIENRSNDPYVFMQLFDTILLTLLDDTTKQTMQLTLANNLEYQLRYVGNPEINGKNHQRKYLPPTTELPSPSTVALDDLSFTKEVYAPRKSPTGDKKSDDEDDKFIHRLLGVGVWNKKRIGSKEINYWTCYTVVDDNPPNISTLSGSSRPSSRRWIRRFGHDPNDHRPVSEYVPWDSDIERNKITDDPLYSPQMYWAIYQVVQKIEPEPVPSDEVPKLLSYVDLVNELKGEEEPKSTVPMRDYWDPPYITLPDQNSLYNIYIYDELLKKIKNKNNNTVPPNSSSVIQSCSGCNTILVLLTSIVPLRKTILEKKDSVDTFFTALRELLKCLAYGKHPDAEIEPFTYKELYNRHRNFLTEVRKTFLPNNGTELDDRTEIKVKETIENAYEFLRYILFDLPVLRRELENEPTLWDDLFNVQMYRTVYTNASPDGTNRNHCAEHLYTPSGQDPENTNGGINEMILSSSSGNTPERYGVHVPLAKPEIHDIVAQKDKDGYYTHLGKRYNTPYSRIDKCNQCTNDKIYSVEQVRLCVAGMFTIFIVDRFRPIIAAPKAEDVHTEQIKDNSMLRLDSEMVFEDKNGKVPCRMYLVGLITHKNGNWNTPNFTKRYTHDLGTFNFYGHIAPTVVKYPGNYIWRMYDKSHYSKKQSVDPVVPKLEALDTLDTFLYHLKNGSPDKVWNHEPIHTKQRMSDPTVENCCIVVYLRKDFGQYRNGKINVPNIPPLIDYYKPSPNIQPSLDNNLNPKKKQMNMENDHKKLIPVKVGKHAEEASPPDNAPESHDTELQAKRIDQLNEYYRKWYDTQNPLITLPPDFNVQYWQAVYLCLNINDPWFLRYESSSSSSSLRNIAHRSLYHTLSYALYGTDMYFDTVHAIVKIFLINFGMEMITVYPYLHNNEITQDLLRDYIQRNCMNSRTNLQPPKLDNKVVLLTLAAIECIYNVSIAFYTYSKPNEEEFRFDAWTTVEESDYLLNRVSPHLGYTHRPQLRITQDLTVDAPDERYDTVELCPLAPLSSRAPVLGSASPGTIESLVLTNIINIRNYCRYGGMRQRDNVYYYDNDSRAIEHKATDDDPYLPVNRDATEDELTLFRSSVLLLNPDFKQSLLFGSGWPVFDTDTSTMLGQEAVLFRTIAVAVYNDANRDREVRERISLYILNNVGKFSDGTPIMDETVRGFAIRLKEQTMATLPHFEWIYRAIQESYRKPLLIYYGRDHATVNHRIEMHLGNDDKLEMILRTSHSNHPLSLSSFSSSSSSSTAEGKDQSFSSSSSTLLPTFLQDISVYTDYSSQNIQNKCIRIFRHGGNHFPVQVVPTALGTAPMLHTQIKELDEVFHQQVNETTIPRNDTDMVTYLNKYRKYQEKVVKNPGFQIYFTSNYRRRYYLTNIFIEDHSLESETKQLTSPQELADPLIPHGLCCVRIKPSLSMLSFVKNTVLKILFAVWFTLLPVIVGAFSYILAPLPYKEVTEDKFTNALFLYLGVFDFVIWPSIIAILSQLPVLKRLPGIQWSVKLAFIVQFWAVYDYSDDFLVTLYRYKGVFPLGLARFIGFVTRHAVTMDNSLLTPNIVPPEPLISEDFWGQLFNTTSMDYIWTTSSPGTTVRTMTPTTVIDEAMYQDPRYMNTQGTIKESSVWIILLAAIAVLTIDFVFFTIAKLGLMFTHWLIQYGKYTKAVKIAEHCADARVLLSSNLVALYEIGKSTAQERMVTENKNNKIISPYLFQKKDFLNSRPLSRMVRKPGCCRRPRPTLTPEPETTDGMTVLKDYTIILQSALEHLREGREALQALPNRKLFPSIKTIPKGKETDVSTFYDAAATVSSRTPTALVHPILIKGICDDKVIKRIVSTESSSIWKNSSYLRTYFRPQDTDSLESQSNLYKLFKDIIVSTRTRTTHILLVNACAGYLIQDARTGYLRATRAVDEDPLFHTPRSVSSVTDMEETIKYALQILQHRNQQRLSPGQIFAGWTDIVFILQIPPPAALVRAEAGLRQELTSALAFFHPHGANLRYPVPSWWKNQANSDSFLAAIDNDLPYGSIDPQNSGFIESDDIIKIIQQIEDYLFTVTSQGRPSIPDISNLTRIGTGNNKILAIGGNEHGANQLLTRNLLSSVGTMLQSSLLQQLMPRWYETFAISLTDLQIVQYHYGEHIYLPTLLTHIENIARIVEQITSMLMKFYAFDNTVQATSSSSSLTTGNSVTYSTIPLYNPLGGPTLRLPTNIAMDYYNLRAALLRVLCGMVPFLQMQRNYLTVQNTVGWLYRQITFLRSHEDAALILQIRTVCWFWYERTYQDRCRTVLRAVHTMFDNTRNAPRPYVPLLVKESFWKQFRRATVYGFGTLLYNRYGIDLHRPSLRILSRDVLRIMFEKLWIDYDTLRKEMDTYKNIIETRIAITDLYQWEEAITLVEMQRASTGFLSDPPLPSVQAIQGTPADIYQPLATFNLSYRNDSIRTAEAIKLLIPYAILIRCRTRIIQTAVKAFNIYRRKYMFIPSDKSLNDLHALNISQTPIEIDTITTAPVISLLQKIRNELHPAIFEILLESDKYITGIDTLPIEDTLLTEPDISDKVYTGNDKVFNNKLPSFAYTDSVGVPLPPDDDIPPEHKGTDKTNKKRYIIRWIRSFFIFILQWLHLIVSRWERYFYRLVRQFHRYFIRDFGSTLDRFADTLGTQHLELVRYYNKYVAEPFNLSPADTKDRNRSRYIPFMVWCMFSYFMYSNPYYTVWLVMSAIFLPFLLPTIAFRVHSKRLSTLLSPFTLLFSLGGSNQYRLDARIKPSSKIEPVFFNPNPHTPENLLLTTPIRRRQLLQAFGIYTIFPFVQFIVKLSYVLMEYFPPPTDTNVPTENYSDTLLSRRSASSFSLTAWILSTTEPSFLYWFTGTILRITWAWFGVSCFILPTMGDNHYYWTMAVPLAKECTKMAKEITDVRRAIPEPAVVFQPLDGYADIFGNDERAYRPTTISKKIERANNLLKECIRILDILIDPSNPVNQFEYLLPVDEQPLRTNILECIKRIQNLVQYVQPQLTVTDGTIPAQLIPIAPTYFVLDEKFTKEYKKIFTSGGIEDLEKLIQRYLDLSKNGFTTAEGSSAYLVQYVRQCHQMLKEADEGIKRAGKTPLNKFIETVVKLAKLFETGALPYAPTDYVQKLFFNGVSPPAVPVSQGIFVFMMQLLDDIHDKADQYLVSDPATEIVLKQLIGFFDFLIHASNTVLEHQRQQLDMTRRQTKIASASVPLEWIASIRAQATKTKKTPENADTLYSSFIKQTTDIVQYSTECRNILQTIIDTYKGDTYKGTLLRARQKLNSLLTLTPRFWEEVSYHLTVPFIRGGSASVYPLGNNAHNQLLPALQQLCAAVRMGRIAAGDFNTGNNPNNPSLPSMLAPTQTYAGVGRNFGTNIKSKNHDEAAAMTFNNSYSFDTWGTVNRAIEIPQDSEAQYSLLVQIGGLLDRADRENISMQIRLRGDYHRYEEQWNRENEKANELDNRQRNHCSRLVTKLEGVEFDLLTSMDSAALIRYIGESITQVVGTSNLRFIPPMEKGSVILIFEVVTEGKSFNRSLAPAYIRSALLENNVRRELDNRIDRWITEHCRDILSRENGLIDQPSIVTLRDYTWAYYRKEKLNENNISTVPVVVETIPHPLPLTESSIVLNSMVGDEEIPPLAFITVPATADSILNAVNDPSSSSSSSSDTISNVVNDPMANPILGSEKELAVPNIGQMLINSGRITTTTTTTTADPSISIPTVSNISSSIMNDSSASNLSTVLEEVQSSSTVPIPVPNNPTIPVVATTEEGKVIIPSHSVTSTTTTATVLPTKVGKDTNSNVGTNETIMRTLSTAASLRTNPGGTSRTNSRIRVNNRNFDPSTVPSSFNPMTTNSLDYPSMTTTTVSTSTSMERTISSLSNVAATTVGNTALEKKENRESTSTISSNFDKSSKELRELLETD